MNFIYRILFPNKYKKMLTEANREAMKAMVSHIQMRCMLFLTFDRTTDDQKRRLLHTLLAWEKARGYEVVYQARKRLVMLQDKMLNT